MPILVGLSGKIGAGKDVVASYLTRKHGFQIIRFSDSLKLELSNRLGRTLRAHVQMCYPDVPPDEREWYSWRLLTTKRDPVTRALLQEYGTEVRRFDDPDYWVKRWEDRVERSGGSVVAPDLRFPNEAHSIKRRGGHLLRVIRPGQDESQHASETSMDEWGEWDHILMNIKGIPELEEQVERWLDHMSS